MHGQQNIKESYQDARSTKPKILPYRGSQTDLEKSVYTETPMKNNCLESA